MLSAQSTEVRFASFLSGGFTTMAVINPPESKLAKRTSVHWAIINFDKNTSNVTILNRNGEWKFGDDLLNSWNITWTLNFPDNTRGCR